MISSSAIRPYFKAYSQIHSCRQEKKFSKERVKTEGSIFRDQMPPHQDVEHNLINCRPHKHIYRVLGHIDCTIHAFQFGDLAFCRRFLAEAISEL